MQSLIARGTPEEETQITGSVVDFVRLKEDTVTQTKRRSLSRPQAQAKPPPPTNTNSVEDQYWEAIKNSRDQKDFQDYLKT